MRFNHIKFVLHGEKSMKKKIITIAIIGIFLLTSFTTLPVVGIKIISQDKAISENILSANTYDSRGPIEIYGNDDFTEENGVRNPEADGTENDPYIISGWRLPYILVHFTTTYFTISNCYIEDCGGPCYSGIELKEVKNGTIEKCSMSNLYLYQTLRENGITLKNTQNINIKDCNIFAHFFGIECFDSNNNKIRHCDIYGPAYGLFWFNANYNEIYQCKIGGFISSGVCGVNLDRCNNNIIHHCIISKTIAGVNLLDSNGNIFHHNNIFDNYRYNAVVENGENQWDDGIRTNTET